MNDALRKGWCPGALRPMMAKDGLLVRLRITGGILPAATALALADLSRRHGNGALDLSARGNLQMRGVAPDRLSSLQDDLHALGLLDENAAAEAVRNVIASPLSGLHAGIDIRPLVAALEARLTRDDRLHALPTKFGFLIDDGGAPSLGGIAADIRFDWCPDDRRFALGLGGAREDALRVASCRPDELVDRATHLALRVLGLMKAHPRARRVQTLIQDLGETTVARACGADLIPLRFATATNTETRRFVGARRENGISFLGLAAPFGRLDHMMLAHAATLAARSPLGEIRLTPWRILFIPTDDAQIDDTLSQGFVVDAGDPRLQAEACVGEEGCERGTTPTRHDATALAELFRTSGALHVSGCEKGCAKPSASPVTLVARDGRYDLVRNGCAGDSPIRRDLDLAAARDAIVSLMETA